MSSHAAPRVRHDSYDFISPTKYKGKLSNKTVLVTGAGRGIGRHIAEAFAAAGAAVACNARTEADIAPLAHELSRKYSTRVVAIAGDVARDPAALVTTVEVELGPIDILVNNAGISRFSTLEHEDVEMEKWWRVLEVNLKAPISLTRAVLPGMLRRGGGYVLNTTSIAGVMDAPYFSAYCASKAALTKATHVLDFELRRKKIYSFAVHPGGVDTRDGPDETANDTAMKAESRMQKIWDAIPKHMEDSPKLVADTMVALVSEERAKGMSGRFIDCTQDLEDVLAHVQDIRQDNLYTLRLGKL